MPAFDAVAKLNSLAVERAAAMERIQEIDDEASKLITTVRLDVEQELDRAERRSKELTTTWGHLEPDWARTRPGM